MAYTNRPTRRKPSRFNGDTTSKIDYKNPNMLRSFVTETGKIIPARITGNSAKEQREIGVAIRRARFLALMPFCDQHEN